MPSIRFLLDISKYLLGSRLDPLPEPNLKEIYLSPGLLKQKPSILRNAEAIRGEERKQPQGG